MSRWNPRAARPLALAATLLAVAACGSSAGTPSGPSGSSDPTAPAQPASAAPSQGAGDSSAASSLGANGPIGGDIGDRSKGSVQAQISGGLTDSIDLPFGAAAARLLVDGSGTAYLPYTDPAKGTLFLTINGDQLGVQYAGPNNAALTNGGTPCDLKLDALDADQAKGSFTCHGLMLIQGDSIGSADMTGAFEAHR